MIVIILLFAMVSGASQASETERFIVTLQDTGKALVNPGMGWTMHFYSNIPSNYGSKLEPEDTLDDFPGLSTVYLRIPWAFLEPEEGKFNWAMLDTPAQRWIAKGKKAAFCITCSENWIPFATPEWVKNAGAKGTFYIFGKGPDPNGKLWDPDFEDPLFLEKLEKFLKAMSARYDGNPDIAFVDIGSYGLWGEGHTHMSSQVSKEREYPIMCKHIDLHLKYFKNTLLCISDDFAGHDKPGARFPITDYALSKGVSLRDDSIMVQPPPRSWYHAEMAQAFWPLFPVILEHEHYGGSKERGAWGDGSLLLKAVEDYHAAYLSIHWWPHEFLKENREIIDKINLRLGYRLQLREIDLPKTIKIGDWFMVETRWANAGVAPCYPGGFFALTIKNASGGIVSVMTDEGFDMKELHVGPPEKAPVKILQSKFRIGLDGPTTKPGSYDVFISAGRRDGTPEIALPLPNEDGQRRYQVGKIDLNL